MSTPLLNVQNLKIALQSGDYRHRVVDDVSFSVSGGETLAIVGESGCGKTMTALSLLRLEPAPGVKIVGGSIDLQGEDLAKLDDASMSRVRGRRIAMIFQEPMNALNPTMTVGNQIAEAIRAHSNVSGEAARQRVRELLHMVRLPDPARQMDEYPHRLSGGMRQRVMIAMALSCEPEILIADEPTTALDVTIQAQILALLVELQKRTGIGIVLITHDLSVVRRMAQRVMVMYAGRVAEIGTTAEVLRNPRHPYTRGLMGAIPQTHDGAPPGRRLTEIPGTVPAPGTVGVACAFANRCSHTVDTCREGIPPLIPIGPTHGAACTRLEMMA